MIRTGAHRGDELGAGAQDRRSLRGDLLPIAAIIVIWLATILIVNPRGEFPLNDDWCYARSVYVLLHTGALKFVPILTTTLVAQVLWGALFCLPFGFSFMALRASTLILGLVGILAVYALLREIGAPRWVAVLGSLTVALNPIYFQLSNTFMTDVPFFAFGALSIYAYLRGMRRESGAWIAVGVIFSLAATLTRQLGIAIPIGFAAGYLARNGVRRRNIATAIAPVAIVLAALLVYLKWLEFSGRLPEFFNKQAADAAEFLASGFDNVIAGVAIVTRTALVYLGLFLFPFLISTPGGHKSLPRRWEITNRLCAGALFAVIMGTLIAERKWMPLCGNCIGDFGLGPATLYDTGVFLLPNLPAAPEWFWIVVTVVGALGAALVFHRILASVEMLFMRGSASSDERAAIVMALAISLLLLGAVAPLAKIAYYDRYFLFLMPVLMVMIVLTSRSLTTPSRALKLIGIAVLLIWGGVAVCGTHDYLAWNRARWKALDDMMRNMRVPIERIEGGYEFDGWYRIREDSGPDWQFFRSEDYIVTFGPVYDYDELRRYEYRRWMPPRKDYIYVLRGAGVE